MDTFIEKQRLVNVQANQKIDIVEISLNKEFDGFQTKLIINLTTCSAQFQGMPVSNMFIKRKKIQRDSV